LAGIKCDDIGTTEKAVLTAAIADLISGVEAQNVGNLSCDDGRRRRLAGMAARERRNATTTVPAEKRPKTLSPKRSLPAAAERASGVHKFEDGSARRVLAAGMADISVTVSVDSASYDVEDVYAAVTEAVADAVSSGALLSSIASYASVSGTAAFDTTTIGGSSTESMVPTPAPSISPLPSPAPTKSPTSSPSPAPTPPPTAAPTQSPTSVPTPAPSVTCETGTSIYRLRMFDSGGDGWQGAKYTVRNSSALNVAGEGVFITSGALATGSEGYDWLCLADGCVVRKKRKPCD